MNVFYHENNLVYHVHISDKKFENHMDLLMITDGNKPHYVYIKDFNRKCRTKEHFCKYFLQCSSGKRILIQHKETF